MDPRNPKLWMHVVVVALLLLMPLIDAPTPDPTSLLLLGNPFFEIDVVVHAFCIGFGYINYYLLVPVFYSRRKKVTYFLITMLCFVLICLIPPIMSHVPFIPFYEEHTILKIHTIIQTRHIFYMFVMMFLLSLTTRVNLRLREVEQEKSLAEIRYLKAQIHPHFLFNTLNSIYSLIQINPASAGRSLLKMSNVMRYILQASETNYEPLSQAVGYLEDYIDLQKERFRGSVAVDYSCTGSAGDLRIASLILVPFVENAFKYGVNPEFEAKISIAISIVGNNLNMQVVNTDFSQHHSDVLGTGTGVLNTRNRLELMYAGHYRLDISNLKGLFHVDLQMTLE
jgi:LytS/YehU family sensor histidine kinase